MQEDDPKIVKKVRKSITSSQLRDPLRCAPYRVRQIVGAIITITIMLVFAYLGDLILGEPGACVGGLTGFFLGLWLPPHLHEHDEHD